jgi:hypothetical protein
MNEKINSMQNELKRAIRPMLIRGWNLNNEEKCYDVNISFAYFPKEFDGENPPRIRYDIILQSGRTQDRFHCSKHFVEMIDCITTNMYKRMVGLD